MELRHLRYFCAVAETEGFSHAARLLHVSQSAISEQIADLEREIGVPLIVRGRPKIRVTPHGEVFLAEARKVLADAGHAIEMARRSLTGEIGTLKIGFFGGGTGTLVPKLIKDFRQRHPGIRVSLSEMVTTRQLAALMDGTLDIGFTRRLDAPFDQHLRSELMYHDQLVAVVPRNHPLAPGPIDLRALAGERFVLVARESAPPLFDKIISLCSKAGFSPEIVATATFWSSVALLVQSGEGITILPRNLQHKGASDLAYCPLTSRDASIELVMAWSPARQNVVQKAFLDLVRESKGRISKAAERA